MLYGWIEPQLGQTGSPLVSDQRIFLNISCIYSSLIMAILTINNVLASADSKKCCAMI